MYLVLRPTVAYRSSNCSFKTTGRGRTTLPGIVIVDDDMVIDLVINSPVISRVYFAYSHRITYILLYIKISWSDYFVLFTYFHQIKQQRKYFNHKKSGTTVFSVGVCIDCYLY